MDCAPNYPFRKSGLWANRLTIPHGTKKIKIAIHLSWGKFWLVQRCKLFSRHQMSASCSVAVKWSSCQVRGLARPSGGAPRTCQILNFAISARKRNKNEQASFALQQGKPRPARSATTALPPEQSRLPKYPPLPYLLCTTQLGSRFYPPHPTPLTSAYPPCSTEMTAQSVASLAWSFATLKIKDPVFSYPCPCRTQIVMLSRPLVFSPIQVHRAGMPRARSILNSTCGAQTEGECCRTAC